MKSNSLGFIVVAALLASAACDEDAPLAPVPRTITCDFGGKFRGEVELRSQDEDANLCSAPVRTVNLDPMGAFDFEEGDSSEVLVWIKAEQGNEVWRLRFRTGTCELALPFEPGCVSATDAGSD